MNRSKNKYQKIIMIETLYSMNKSKNKSELLSNNHYTFCVNFGTLKY